MTMAGWVGDLRGDAWHEAENLTRMCVTDAQQVESDMT